MIFLVKNAKVEDQQRDDDRDKEQPHPDGLAQEQQ
jgi:hypothetical protein